MLLWELALRIEEGELSVAERELRRLQQELQEALANNAPDEEIERLMNELQEAMDQFMTALTEKLKRDMEQQGGRPHHGPATRCRGEEALDGSPAVARPGPPHPAHRHRRGECGAGHGLDAPAQRVRQLDRADLAVGPVELLLVEDDQTLLETLTYNLSREGYEVIAAEDGVTALDLARKHQPDLVVLDILLPRCDGLSVLRTTRGHGVHTPVLLLTLCKRVLSGEFRAG